jgi:hypothetical protein
VPFVPYSLTGIEAVPPWGRPDRLQRRSGRAVNCGPSMAVRFAYSACEQSVLLGPIERQIEFGQPRRGELDGLPAL